MAKFLSKLNSSNIILNPGQSFIGQWEKCSDFVSIEIYCYSDKSSVDEGLILEGINHLSNTSNITQYDRLLYTANNNFYKQYKIITNYYRIRYINSSSQQNIFSINTYMINSYTKLDTILVPDGETLISNQPQLDAFDRLRTSQPFTILDIKHTPGLGLNNILVCYSTTNATNATNTLQSNASCVDMVLTGSGSASSIAQSRRYITYQPGKSLLILMTGVLNAANNGLSVVSKIGYFDDNNGFFFQWTNNTLSIVRRSKVTGTPIDTPIIQSNWNVDKLNGTGKSGINLDVSKTQIFIFDLEWLGVGTVRAGVVVNGIIYYCHQFNHANSLTNVYMTTANLPMRYEISCDSGSETGTLRKICCSAISEGGYNPVGFLFDATLANNFSRLDASPIERPILALRLKVGYRTTVIPNNLYVYCQDANVEFSVILRLFLSPTTSPILTLTWTWQSVSDLSACEYGKGPDAPINNTSTINTSLLNLTLFNRLYKGTAGFNLDDILNTVNNIIYLSKDITVNSDYLIISLISYTGDNKDFSATLSWTEIN